MSKDILYPLRRFHGMLVERKIQQQEIRAIRDRFMAMRRENPRAAFLIFTPAHGNLGDHAIAQAEKKLLQERHIAYLEITGEQLHAMKCRGTLRAMNGFPIIVHGGGYLGTIWMAEERLLRDVISVNRRSTVFAMPNTIFYEQTPTGKREMEESVKIYGKHKRLYLCARENISYHQMQQLYKNVMLFPDMVMSLNESNRTQERKGCLLCLRQDREKTRTKEQEKAIREAAASLFDSDVYDTDMLFGKDVLPEQRDAVLDGKYDEFAGAKLVITDRLHGMIFCAITGTPCVVIDSKSPKLRGCYEWIKDLDYICFVDDIAQLEEAYNSIPTTKCAYNNEHLKHYFLQLQDELIRRFGWE